MRHMVMPQATPSFDFWCKSTLLWPLMKLHFEDNRFLQRWLGGRSWCGLIYWSYFSKHIPLNSDNDRQFSAYQIYLLTQKETQMQVICCQTSWSDDRCGRASCARHIGGTWHIQPQRRSLLRWSWIPDWKLSRKVASATWVLLALATMYYNQDLGLCIEYSVGQGVAPYAVAVWVTSIHLWRRHALLPGLLVIACYLSFTPPLSSLSMSFSTCRRVVDICECMCSALQVFWRRFWLDLDRLNYSWHKENLKSKTCRNARQGWEHLTKIKSRHMNLAHVHFIWSMIFTGMRAL